jgi:cell division protein FtsL
MKLNKLRKRRWKRLLQYQWIVKHLPFFLFVTVLAVVYIANGHYSDKTIKNINSAHAELKQLQYRYKILKAEVMNLGKESEIVKAVERYGLKRLMTPPVVLTDKQQGMSNEQ